MLVSTEKEGIRKNSIQFGRIKLAKIKSRRERGQQTIGEKFCKIILTQSTPSQGK